MKHRHWRYPLWLQALIVVAIYVLLCWPWLYVLDHPFPHWYGVGDTLRVLLLFYYSAVLLNSALKEAEKLCTRYWFSRQSSADSSAGNEAASIRRAEKYRYSSTYGKDTP